VTTPTAPTTGCPWCRSHAPLPALGADARVSAVVLHYEQPEALARTLRCLGDQTVPLHEVVVADDGSSRPPAAEGLRVVTQPDRGFRAARARNLGLAEVTGDVVVMLDADTSPEPTYVEQVLAALQEAPDALAVGRRRHADLAGDLDVETARRDAFPEPAWLEDGYARTDDLRVADDASFRYVLGAVLSCRTDLLHELGGFDATLVGYGGEDWELAHRWWTAGGSLRRVREAVAWHDGPDASQQERTWDPAAEDPRAAEAVAVADRVPTWPTAWRGLIGSAPRTVVTHDDDLPEAAVWSLADSLLAAEPQARVVTRPDLAAGVPADPRVVARLAPGDAWSATRHVHVSTPGAWAEVDGWRDLLGRPHGRTTWEQAGRRVVEVTDLRALRRSHRGLEPLQCGTRDLGVSPLRPAGASVAAWLGGWA